MPHNLREWFEFVIAAVAVVAAIAFVLWLPGVPW